jgi:hypothetical protein
LLKLLKNLQKRSVKEKRRIKNLRLKLNLNKSTKSRRLKLLSKLPPKSNPSKKLITQTKRQHAKKRK